MPDVGLLTAFDILQYMRNLMVWVGVRYTRIYSILQTYLTFIFPIAILQTNIQQNIPENTVPHNAAS